MRLPRSWRFRAEEVVRMVVGWLAEVLAERLRDLVRPIAYQMRLEGEKAAQARADDLALILARFDAVESKVRDLELSVNRTAYATESHRTAVESESEEIIRQLRHLSRAVNGTEAEARRVNGARAPREFTHAERQ